MGKLEKVIKELGKDTVAEMEAMSEQGLRGVIVSANQAMKSVADELEGNPNYQEIKESLKALGAGKRDVNKRQKARISFALKLLSDHGKEPFVEASERP